MCRPGKKENVGEGRRKTHDNAKRVSAHLVYFVVRSSSLCVQKTPDRYNERASDARYNDTRAEGRKREKGAGPAYYSNYAVPWLTQRKMGVTQAYTGDVTCAFSDDV